MHISPVTLISLTIFNLFFFSCPSFKIFFTVHLEKLFFSANIFSKCINPAFYKSVIEQKLYPRWTNDLNDSDFHSLPLRKIPWFHLISWCGNFVERHSFHIILGDSPETMRKLCLSAKFSNQEIRWNYSILRNVR